MSVLEEVRDPIGCQHPRTVNFPQNFLILQVRVLKSEKPSGAIVLRNGGFLQAVGCLVDSNDQAAI